MSQRSRLVTRRRPENALAKLVEDGPYFTDGVRLLRLAGVVSGSAGPKLVELEDCRTLSVFECTEEELALFGLVPVTARPRGADVDDDESASAPRHGEHRRRARAHHS